MLTHVYMEWVSLLVISRGTGTFVPCSSAGGFVVAFAVTVAFVKQKG